MKLLFFRVFYNTSESKAFLYTEFMDRCFLYYFCFVHFAAQFELYSRTHTHTHTYNINAMHTMHIVSKVFTLHLLAFFCLSIYPMCGERYCFLEHVSLPFGYFVLTSLDIIFFNTPRDRGDGAKDQQKDERDRV